MARPKLSLRKRKDAELVSFSQNVLNQLAGSSEFPGLKPDLPTIEGAVTDFRDSINQVAVLQGQLRAAVTRKRQRRGKLETTLTQAASYVTAASLGNKTKLIAIGVDIIERGSRQGLPPQVENLSAKAGDRESRVKLRWKAMKRARIFEVQWKLHGTESEWMPQDFVTRSSTHLDGLPPGQMCVFRVRAHATAGPGPWSDPAFCRAP